MADPFLLCRRESSAGCAAVRVQNVSSARKTVKDANISKLQAKNEQHAATTSKLKGKLESESERPVALEANLATAQERAMGIKTDHAEQAEAMASLQTQRLLLGILFAAALLASIFLRRQKPQDG